MLSDIFFFALGKATAKFSTIILDIFKFVIFVNSDITNAVIFISN